MSRAPPCRPSPPGVGTGGGVEPHENPVGCRLQHRAYSFGKKTRKYFPAGGAPAYNRRHFEGVTSCPKAGDFSVTASPFGLPHFAPLVLIFAACVPPSFGQQTP